MGCFEEIVEPYYDPDSSCKKIFWIVISIILGVSVLVISFALLGVSVNKVVENNEYGVVYYGKTTMEFGNIYEQGIYSISPGASMMIFHRTLQDVDTGTIGCFSSDRIQITLTVAAQYQLVKNDIIPAILQTYGGNDEFVKILSFVIKNLIIERCGQYSAEDFYNFRAEIDQDMYQTVLVDVNNNTIGATIEFFQLINIGFPTEFSHAITGKQIVIQEAVTKLNQRSSLLTAANTTLLQAQRTANITLLNAYNTAEINLRTANTTRDIIFTQWLKRAESYLSIMTTLGLNETGFIEYLRNDVLRFVNSPIINI